MERRLLIHIFRLTGVVLFQMTCSFCFKIFTHKRAFVFHLRAAHKLGEQVRCPRCDRDDFMSLTTYTKHLKNCEKTVASS